MSWSWWGFPGALLPFFAWITAGIALKAGGRRRLNRLLALLLFLEGTYGGANFGFVFFVTDAGWARILSLLGGTAAVVLPLQYLVFLGEALKTRWVRWLRARWVVALLHAASSAAAVLFWLRPDRVVSGIQPSDLGTWNFRFVELGLTVTQLHGVVAFFALAVAIVAYRGAPQGSTSRNVAKWFVVAFGLRDGFLVVANLLIPVLRPVPFWGDLIYNPVVGSVYLLYILLLAYAILRHQLFDIDLRLRFALRQGSAGAFIALSFLAISEVLEAVIAVDSIVLGVLLALVIAAALRPAQTLAERLVSRLMPGVHPTDEYLEGRKLEVLRAAVEGAVADGVVSARERTILARIREELDLPERALLELEREVVRQATGSPPPRA